MKFSYNTQTLASWTSIAVTVAVLAKTFVPFYLINSTAIFSASVAVGLVLAALSWRPVFNGARHIRHILIVAAPLYAVVVVSFLAYSRAAVPATHLWGILIFHAIFLIFGFSAARSLKTVLQVLLGMATIYAALLAVHALRFGGVTTGINIDDIFGIGDPAIFITFHQNIGIVLGIGALALLGLASNRVTQILAVSALPIVLVFLFHIAARAALVALASSLVFAAGAALWARSKKLAVLSALAAVVAVTLVSGFFYQRALEDKDVNALAPDAISRTIRELQDPRPFFRMQIWARTWHRILSEPDRLLLGRGIGMFPVDEGYGAPDWLLRRAEGSKYYPHNVHLEMLYETGITGLLLFSILTLIPLVTSLRRWHLLSPAEKSSVLLYVFSLVSAGLSGAFAFSYDFQFFFALAVGMIAFKQPNDFAVSGPPASAFLGPKQPAQVSF